MATDTLRQVAALAGMSGPELQERWRVLMGGEPPRYNRDLLVKRLAYRLQELAHGGLAQTARATMKQLLVDAGVDELGVDCVSAGRSSQRNDVPVIGTRLVREWNGARYEVTVVNGGFEYHGRCYRSLTAVAEAITGTHWNGRVFFGLRPKQGRRSR